jgi:hypothetical protein
LILGNNRPLGGAMQRQGAWWRRPLVVPHDATLCFVKKAHFFI